MGNWRRVMIEGTCAEDEVAALNKGIDQSAMMTGAPNESPMGFHPLCFCGGLCGLPLWGARTINAVGNLAERDYSDEDVAGCLQRLAALAPSLEVKAHIGADYEKDECTATVTLTAGVAVVGEPEREMIPEITESSIQANMLAALVRPQLT